MNRTRFETTDGFFELERYPARKTESLRAWNAADALLVEQIQAKELPPHTVLSVNDEHGALSVALQAAAAWTDSALSTLAIEQNLRRNGCSAVPIIASTQAPSKDFSIAAIKVPKLLPYFEYQLALLAAVMSPGAAVMAAGMDKHLPPGTAGLLSCQRFQEGARLPRGSPCRHRPGRDGAVAVLASGQ